MQEDLFPYDEVREIQSDLIEQIKSAVKSSENLIVHAPTGLGKTAASIAAALSNTIHTDKTIFFLTSMHTQHKIAIDTVKEIKKKHGVKMVAVDVIGKKHMCLQPGVETLRTKEFSEYCKALREDNKCEYYSNLKKGESLSFDAKLAVQEIKDVSPVMTDEMIDISSKHQVCPYEVSMIIGKESKVIVTDYYYLFHPRIRASFLNKVDKALEEAIIIVDEGHNLPNRIKDLASEKISNYILKRAISEAEKYERTDLLKPLQKILGIIEGYSEKTEDEIYVTRNDFIDRIQESEDYDSLIEMFEDAGDFIREDQKYSYIGSLAMFMEAWTEETEGFTRIFSRSQGMQEEFLQLAYKCLDPGVISKPVIENAATTILMSGTLTPTHMYKEVLGFPSNTKEATLKSPFPEENRLNIIIPKTSTKYSTRSEDQYKEIGSIVSRVANAIPGNSAIFFPSYRLMEDVYKYMGSCEKTVFKEKAGLSKSEKETMLENFKGYKNTGAVLLGVTSGSFGEGIDLPGDYLKGVVVVGLPLNRPDLETKALIDYYDRKFRKGWDYGYVYPAFNKTLQSAGRCIRSETDRGVIVFLDERYAWNKYMSCFPETWNLKVTLLYEKMIRQFFGVKGQEEAKSLNDF